MWLLTGLLGALAGIVQLGAVPTLVPEPEAAPLLPVAFVAAWSAVRGGPEAAPAMLTSALVLGVASQERAGWFLIALLPAAALVALVELYPGTPSLLVAAASAGGGALGYSMLLALAAGAPSVAVIAPQAQLGGALWTAAVAALLALFVLPLRRRADAGLFR